LDHQTEERVRLKNDALTALTREIRALSAVLDKLQPADLRRATNCPPWSLEELIVHIAASIRVGDTPFPRAEPHEEPGTAADYYRRPERDTSSYRQDNVDRTAQLTRKVVADKSAVRWFDDVATQTIAALSGWDLDQVVVVPGRGAMRLADWVTTRVISVAAHGLDVAITLGYEPWTTRSALQAVRPVFVELLGTPLPGALKWDDAAFLATATGRRALTGREAELLGPHADRFPLLS
jgi:uncharacterized protein (TIGR03083 family)